MVLDLVVDEKLQANNRIAKISLFLYVLMIMVLFLCMIFAFVMNSVLNGIKTSNDVANELDRIGTLSLGVGFFTMSLTIAACCSLVGSCVLRCCGLAVSDV